MTSFNYIQILREEYHSYFMDEEMKVQNPEEPSPSSQKYEVAGQGVDPWQSDFGKRISFHSEFNSLIAPLLCTEPSINKQKGKNILTLS